MPILFCPRRAAATSLLAILVAVVTALSASAQPADRTFAVEVTGSGPDVILVPGLASGGAIWDGTVARLGADHTLHVVTLAGFAGEAPVAASTQDGFLDAVRDDLAAYVRGLDAPAAVVGHSLGGFTALRVGLAAPEAVSHVVVVDALPFLAVMMDSTATEATAAAQGGPMKQMMALSTPEQFRIQQQMALQGMIMSPDSAAAYVDLHAASDIPTVAQAFYDMWTTDLRDDLASMTVPTLVLAAGAGYPPRTAEQVHAMYEAEYAPLDDVRIVAVPDARHFIQLDQPDALEGHVRRFMGEDVTQAQR
ncbi:MAG: alpha/beta hydrolase [Bacteroidota bacterium]